MAEYEGKMYSDHFPAKNYLGEDMEKVKKKLLYNKLNDSDIIRHRENRNMSRNEKDLKSISNNNKDYGKYSGRTYNIRNNTDTSSTSCVSSPLYNNNAKYIKQRNSIEKTNQITDYNIFDKDAPDNSISYSNIFDNNEKHIHDNDKHTYTMHEYANNSDSNKNVKTFSKIHSKSNKRIYADKYYDNNNCNKTYKKHLRKVPRKKRSRSSHRRRRARDSFTEYEVRRKRSRSRERKRVKNQYTTIEKYCQKNDSQVFWDGFQWVTKGEGLPGYDQEMNATRRARRLHIGNLPLYMKVTEADFKHHLYELMLQNNLCIKNDICPILHIWFARDRGGNFGFMEMASVNEAHAAILLDGFMWHGVNIRINRPTDWKQSITNSSIDLLASTSNLAVAESLAAAAQQAAITGNASGLFSLVNHMPESEQKSIIDVMNQQVIPQFRENPSASIHVDFVKEKIKADLLTGIPSRVIRVHKPVRNFNDNDEYTEVLDDIKSECDKYGCILSAIIITPRIKNQLFSVLAEIGDVFFEYATSTQADNCILNMSGRIYDENSVSMVRFDEKNFTDKLKCYSENLFLKVLENIQPSSDSCSD